MAKVPPIYIEPTPVVWHNLPDLRDFAKDVRQWENVAVNLWEVQFLCNATRSSVYRMIKNPGVFTRTAFGRPAVRLGQLPQTARCQYIEHKFREEISIANRLHTGTELAEVLEVPKKSLLYLFRNGMVRREIPPALHARYPHWGLPDSMQRAVEEWVDERVKIKKREKAVRDEWIRLSGFTKTELETEK